jgi:hypothetical protein
MQIKRKVVKKLKNGNDKNTMRKALDYGYDEETSDRMGQAGMVKKNGKKPVAKDTNKTRRPAVKPTKRSSYP